MPMPSPALATRDDLRNVAIVAHVDHGKTTLLDATEEQIEFPIVYASARAGRASLTRPEDGTLPDSPDLEPLFTVLRDAVPAPSYDPDEPLRAHVTNLDASSYLGRIAL